MPRPGIGLDRFGFGWRFNNNQDGHIRILLLGTVHACPPTQYGLKS
jgi:hypothetical protein